MKAKENKIRFFKQPYHLFVNIDELSKTKLLGTRHYLWGGGGGGGGLHRREMLFLVKMLLIQPLKSQKHLLANLKYQLKNKYPPLAKNMSLINILGTSSASTSC
jgi:hypothetical protein